MNTRVAGVPGVGSVRPAGTPSRTGGAGADFAAEFRRQLESVEFSQHARRRMEARGISWGTGQSAKLAGAVGTLASKGGRTSLVLLDDLALVVSVSNRTVITAFQSREQAVFTNIDSAIRV